MFHNLIKSIRTKKLLEAKNQIFEAIQEKVDVLIEDKIRWMQAETILSDEERVVLDEARFRIVPVRIRRGKIQRRKKVSTLAGFTFRSGRLIKMSPKERRNRRLSQRRGKIKRKSKINKSNAKRKRSMRRLRAMGGGRR